MQKKLETILKENGFVATLSTIGSLPNDKLWEQLHQFIWEKVSTSTPNKVIKSLKAAGISVSDKWKEALRKSVGPISEMAFGIVTIELEARMRMVDIQRRKNETLPESEREEVPEVEVPLVMSGYDIVTGLIQNKYITSTEAALGREASELIEPDPEECAEDHEQQQTQVKTKTAIKDLEIPTAASIWIKKITKFEKPALIAASILLIIMLTVIIFSGNTTEDKQHVNISAEDDSRTTVQNDDTTTVYKVVQPTLDNTTVSSGHVPWHVEDSIRSDYFGMEVKYATCSKDPEVISEIHKWAAAAQQTFLEMQDAHEVFPRQ